LLSLRNVKFTVEKVLQTGVLIGEFKLLSLKEDHGLEVAGDVLLAFKRGDALVVFYAKLKEVKHSVVKGAPEDQIIRPLLLVTAETEEGAVLLAGHRFQRDDILERMHVVTVPHEETRGLGLPSQRY
jgi:hypothetical protein